MEQTEYTGNFVANLFSVLRRSADSLSRTMQSGGSLGGGALSWFAANWIRLVLILVVVGVAVDWLVWMIRWRPYWLWFGKKRVVLDNTAKEKKTAPPRPRYHSKALKRHPQPAPRPRPEQRKPQPRVRSPRDDDAFFEMMDEMDALDDMTDMDHTAERPRPEQRKPRPRIRPPGDGDEFFVAMDEADAPDETADMDEEMFRPAKRDEESSRNAFDELLRNTSIDAEEEERGSPFDDLFFDDEDEPREARHSAAEIEEAPGDPFDDDMIFENDGHEDYIEAGDDLFLESDESDESDELDGPDEETLFRLEENTGNLTEDAVAQPDTPQAEDGESPWRTGYTVRIPKIDANSAELSRKMRRKLRGSDE